MRSWSPDEALPTILEAGRTPPTLVEGIRWALQAAGVIEANDCFMTFGSRRIKPNGTPETRTPALWFSSGTGRDVRERKGASRVGWWLGFASATEHATVCATCRMTVPCDPELAAAAPPPAR